ncbi:hypothetical protein CEP52_016329 [Fusarium oligoseptatum]|uniref:FAD dependent oxidoreductase domain-containing protein n=1 Tax=Fusarium oligoseptatum TaxID=2604345 RepID=A0A428S4T3_9HYPO|nr:hypothetical protein CEP52_016329 [Fusarium oligoseptatum]
MSELKDTSILIVGAGTFGLSAALDFSLNGYRNITVLDKGSDIPSPYSAGCDLNKTIRAEYEDDFYTSLALEAIAAWKTPFFEPFYAERASSSSIHPLGRASRPEYPPGTLKQIKSGRDVRYIVPQLTGPMEGWHGYFNKYGGYARAGRAMAKMYATCKERGVRFVLGDQDGNAVSLLFDGKRCKGVKTKSGREHLAAHTIVSLGAHVGRLIPSITPQITAKAWAVAHIQLTPEQARSLAGIPVVNCRDLGFFFEPDAETGLLKLCAHRAGLTNFEVSDNGRASLPATNSRDESTATYVPGGQIPKDDEDRITALIAATIPQFSSLPLTRKFICWCGDTTDSNFIIDYVPDTEDRSLMVFSGDSGHAFKMLPIAGRWAREVLEQGEQKLGSWRFGDLQDVKDVPAWAGEEDCRTEQLGGHQLKSKL